jgi:AraC-like DNA-binding protein
LQKQTSRVAQLIGFECTTSFHRAFQRWTAGTPMKYRKVRRGGAAPAP